MGWMVIMVPTRFPRPYFSRRCGCEWSPQFNCFQIWAERGSRVKLRLIIVDTDNLCICALFVKIPKFHPNQSPNILCQPLVGMFSPGTSPIRRWREFPWGWWRCRCWRPPKSPRSSVRRCPTCHCWMAASGMLEDNKTHQNTRCSGDHSRSIFCMFSMFCMLFVLTSHWQGFHCVRGILN